jgi:DNA-binding transcriptional regulator YbjK
VTTREAILHAALRVIGEHGIAGLTNRLVAKEAGVSLGSLTYHFASQTDLLREALLSFVAGETERIEQLAESLVGSVHSTQDAAAHVQRALSEMALGREQIGVFEVYVQSARDPELHAATQRCFAAYDSVATTVLSLLGFPSPERAARHVVALIAGSQIRRLATGDADTEHIAAGLLMLLNGAGTVGT